MGVVNGINNGYSTNKRAALYYKTEPLYTDVSRYVHTNNWEILQSIKILNSLGFSVDLIDRMNNNWNPTNSYDLFLGLGVGNTGRNFARYAKLSNAPTKILLAMGPQPDVSNRRTIGRYELFRERTGRHAPPMRTVQDVTGDRFVEITKAADFIFSVGEIGTPSYNSFLGHDVPVLNFYPSTSPKVRFTEEWADDRDRNTFLCFAGNGFICKGVDLVVEAFLRDPTKQLNICGPSSERSFFEQYNGPISSAPNIKYHGFIEPGGTRFNQLASKCSYVIFHSAAEGCCTSVATAIRAGLVPIVNPWTGILIEGKEGIMMSEDGDLISNISQAVNLATDVDDDTYRSMSVAAYEKSKLFTQESFTISYRDAVISAIEASK